MHEPLTDAACRVHAGEVPATVSPRHWPLAYVLA